MADTTWCGIVVKGAIGYTAAKAGGQPALGCPLDAEHKSTTYSTWWQPFERGHVWWSRADGGKWHLPTRTVRLKGAKPFRDVAGDPPNDPALATGLRRDVVYRSGRLDRTTPMDRHILQRLGIGSVISFSPVDEPTIAGIERYRYLMRAGDGDGRYEAFVTVATNRQSLGRALTRAAHAHHPVLLHCSAGKDRTGWATAVLQLLCGVPMAVVEIEYLKAGWLRYGDGTVDLTWLRRGLAVLDARYGTVRDYLVTGCLMTPDAVDALILRMRP